MRYEVYDTGAISIFSMPIYDAAKYVSDKESKDLMTTSLGDICKFFNDKYNTRLSEDSTIREVLNTINTIYTRPCQLNLIIEKLDLEVIASIISKLDSYSYYNKEGVKCTGFDATCSEFVIVSSNVSLEKPVKNIDNITIKITIDTFGLRAIVCSQPLSNQYIMASDHVYLDQLRINDNTDLDAMASKLNKLIFNEEFKRDLSKFLEIPFSVQYMTK